MNNLLADYYALLEAVRDFMDMGGPVLYWIAVLALVLWTFLFERLLYLGFSHRRVVRSAIEAWNARKDRKSWYAHQIRERLISEAAARLERNLPIIKALVMLCPLMGLLGTVTGMIEVFEVMAISGSGNPRSLAAGVSKATIPTMAGMVVALSGLFLNTWLQRKAQMSREEISERMTFSK
jgi:biopolymer transport protein ExbB